MTDMRRLLKLARVRSFALKWFWPGLRDKIFPVRVTLRRFAYDLFVLIIKCLLFLFDDEAETLWSFDNILSYLVFNGDELHDTVEAFFEEIHIHIL